MSWFAVFDAVSGRLESVGTVVADAAVLSQRGLTAVEIGFDPRAPTKQWNETARDFDDVTPPKDTLTREAFLARFTEQERQDIFDAARNDGRAAVRVQMQAFLDWLKMVDPIRLDNGYVVKSVQGLETAGLLAAGRAAEVLA